MEGESNRISDNSTPLRCIGVPVQSKYQRALSDHNKALSEMNREVSTLRESHNIYKSKLRDMELDNDELENAERWVQYFSQRKGERPLTMITA